MASQYLAVVEFEHVNINPADRVVNTFAFNWPGAIGPTDAQFNALETAIIDFYNDVASVENLASYISTEIIRGSAAHLLSIYEITGHLDGSAHGSPQRQEAFQLLAADAATNLPSEVAVAVTLRATAWATTPVEAPDGGDPGTEVDRPRQRRTGKLYLGPLTANAGAMVGNVYRVAPGFAADVLQACQELHDEAETPGFVWSVWSRTDATLREITHVQVDNAFDTQRRRGADSSVRDTLAL